tara:strand:- start:369 stop:704 length:336 start_codon:yes stop_codon:yes gene_type:complete
MPQDIKCDNCQKQETAQLKNELHLCRKSSDAKDRKIKALDKKVFILTAIAVGIGAIFGKEALDAIIEWMEKIGDFNSASNNMMTGGVHPAPGTLAVFALYPLLARKSRKRK